MDEQRTWTSEEAMANLESLTKLGWNREQLPEGVGELLKTYETALPQLAAEIRVLRRNLKEAQREAEHEDPDGEPSAEGGSAEEGSESTDAYEDLAAFARRLGLEQR